ncbi:hypothetical protein J1N35_011821, partial [Gossypium stocksii]
GYFSDRFYRNQMILFGQIPSNKLYVPVIIVFLNKFLDNKLKDFLINDININDNDAMTLLIVTLIRS